MNIYSGKDKNGQFICSKDVWTKQKMAELLLRYYPKKEKKQNSIKRK